MKRTITTKDTWGKEDTYEIVDKIPCRFFVWNIGENMGTHEYVIIAEDLYPGRKDDYSINPETVKAVPVTPEEWKKLDRAASVGVNSLRAAEKALKSKRRGYWADCKKAEAEKTIDIFRRITA